MKTLIVLSLVIAATLAVPNSRLFDQWTGFKATHEKVYNNPLEEVRRLAIFKDNLAKIEEHNALYEQGEVTHTKAMNQFGDWTKEEFLEYVNRGKLNKPQKDKKLALKYEASKVPAAASVDWRGKAVSEVKDQGQCGSCWSFSATGAVEGQLALNGGGLVSLSEQNLIDCSTGYGNAACDGGWMGSAFSYIQDYGIMSESAYPYEARLGSCRYDKSRSVTSLHGYYDLPAGSESDLAKAVSNNGPIAIGVDATDELQFYSGGIIFDNTCSASDLNHGVLVVGYGTEGGTDYWIIKNSWGSGWGEKGYYRAARNRNNNCGVASAAELPAL